jgi:hypothetical protein
MLRLLLLPAVALGLPLAALAAPAAAAPAASPDPLNAAAAVPPPRLPGALRAYRPATTPEPGGWREANEKVTRIGGWKTYLREAQQPDPPAPAASAPTAAAAASAPTPPQGGHSRGHH